MKVEGVDKKFAQDLSKKFFNNFHKEQFTKNEEDIEQRYEDIDKEELQCMKMPKQKKHSTTQVKMKGQDLKEKTQNGNVGRSVRKSFRDSSAKQILML